MMKELYGFELLGALSDAFSPSGNERVVLELIKGQVEQYCDEVYFDVVGNLICKISTPKKYAKKTLFCAVADECGFMVKDIDDGGRLSIAALGGLDTALLSARKVTVGYGEKTTVGVVSSKPIHSLSSDERSKPTPIKQIYIELGTDSKEETEKLVKTGDLGTFRSKAENFGDGMFKGKALEYRVGCAVLCELIRKVNKENIDRDLYFAFTTLGATGMRNTGASVAANVIKPDNSYVFGGLGACDVYGAKGSDVVCKLGDGVIVSISDGRTIYAPKQTSELTEKLASLGIQTQPNRSNAGGGIEAEIQKCCGGVRVTSVKIPVRYPRTASCLINKKDYESMLASAEACL
ncbi:MAG: hypothetical protein IJR55_04240 [Clostridia bacterium]|nr:hypothetical protein [Clostridia bacterium]